MKEMEEILDAYLTGNFKTALKLKNVNTSLEKVIKHLLLKSKIFSLQMTILIC